MSCWNEEVLAIMPGKSHAIFIPCYEDWWWWWFIMGFLEARIVKISIIDDSRPFFKWLNTKLPHQAAGERGRTILQQWASEADLTVRAQQLMHSEDGFILLKPSIQIPINDHLMKITIFMAVSALSLSGCDLSLWIKSTLMRRDCADICDIWTLW